MKGIKGRILKQLKSISQVPYLKHHDEAPSPHASPRRILGGLLVVHSANLIRNLKEDDEGSDLVGSSPSSCDKENYRPPPLKGDAFMGSDVKVECGERYRRPDPESETLFDPELLAAFREAVTEHMRGFEEYKRTARARVDALIERDGERDQPQVGEAEEPPAKLPRTDDSSSAAAAVAAASLNPLLEFEYRCPPGGEKSVIEEYKRRAWVDALIERNGEGDPPQVGEAEPPTKLPHTDDSSSAAAAAAAALNASLEFEYRCPPGGEESVIEEYKRRAKVDALIERNGEGDPPQVGEAEPPAKLPHTDDSSSAADAAAAAATLNPSLEFEYRCPPAGEESVIEEYKRRARVDTLIERNGEGDPPQVGEAEPPAKLPRTDDSSSAAATATATAATLNPLLEFDYRCPPGGEESVILYTTTLRGIRKTFEDCSGVRFLLQSLKIRFFERDVSMHLAFRKELWGALEGRAIPPRLFILGRYIGGADEVLGLHEQGRLLPLLQGVPTDHSAMDGSAGSCRGCAGVKFVVCWGCSGSRKVHGEEESGATRCQRCNENGLVLCPICC